MKTMIFINQFDPTGDRVGGIGNYILSFIRFAPPECVFKIIGVSSHLPLNKWQVIMIGGKEVQFLPIVRVGDSNKKERIPLSIRFSLALLKARKSIGESDILFCQRNEYIFPLSSLSNTIFTIIHNDLSLHLDPEKSENGWSRAPWLFLILQKRAFLRANHIFSVNHKSIDFVLSHIPALESKISFVHTWADPERFSQLSPEKRVELGNSFAKLHSVSPGKVRLIFLGRFQKQKNLPLLLESFLSVKESCVLFMAGAGDEKTYVESFIREHGLQKDVILLGNVPHEEVAKVLSSCDIYVSSSNFEGMSIALMEALSCGLYVVTTATGESQWLLDPNSNGVIAKDFELKSFIDALRFAICQINRQDFQFSFEYAEFSAQNSIRKVITEIEKHRGHQ